ncbi:restriction endonuclease subunit S [Terrisporobacter glycolicus]|uniref:restriction endonuclease subunit S n=1 Tax=Terrisporobacter glycolicus TaxID=36841 RepID=UPI003463B567
MEFIKIKDLFTIKKGKKVEQVDKQENTTRYIQIDDLRNNDNIKYCNSNGKYVYAEENDIIIAWDGANAGTIGYGLNGAIGSTLALLSKQDEKFDSEYCGLFLKSKFKYLRDKCTGATIPHISKSSLEELKIPRLELEEQLKIVNIINLSQKLIDKRKEQITLLDELVKSRFIEMFGDPINNSKEWKKVKLETLGEWKTGGTPSRSNPEYFKGKIPWLSSGELNNKYCFESNEHITEEAISNSATKLIKKESLLLGMYDTAALKSTINMIECTCNQAIAYSKLSSELVNTVYVYYCIQIGKDYYKSLQRGVRQKNLNLTMVKELEIILPILELQNEFADFVNQVDKLKFEMERSLKELEDNFNSLMQKAFKGELF